MRPSPLRLRGCASVGAVLLLFALGACAQAAAPATSSAPPVTEPEPLSTTTTTTTTVPDTTDSEPDTTAPPILSSSEVFAHVSPSVAFIETPAATGSGVLIKGGYVVTNHHVVWPFETARVVFPDGSEVRDVPVLQWDFFVDLAVLGPVEVLAPPLRLEDGEAMTPGEDLWLVGYPGESEVTPQPTISRGILSRFREWEDGGMTLLQTDAVIAGGQSGGALVDSSGRVVGISTFGLDGFGLALSAADAASLVEVMLSPDHPPIRRLDIGGPGAREFDLEFTHLWDVRSYAVEAAGGTVVEVELDGAGDGMFSVSGPAGVLATEDYTETGVEEVSVEAATDGLHFLQVELAAGEPTPFTVRSNIEWIPFADSDDGLGVRVGETIAATLDYPSDADWYSIQLQEGETVRITVESIAVDAVVYMYPATTDGEFAEDEYASDDDSGGGVFGLDAELVYRPLRTGEFFIAVADSWTTSVGGYYLSVERALSGG